MDVAELVKMKEGLGDKSYAQNSHLQKKTTDAVKKKMMSSAARTWSELTPQAFAVADLGCASGRNSLSLISDLVQAIFERSRGITVPEFIVYLNDLPTNDFSSVFKSIPGFFRSNLCTWGGDKVEDLSIFFAAVPGSFYGRLFPRSSLHFIISCNSLHWLSQVPEGLYDEMGKPINKSNIYISESSPPVVAELYSKQFRKDFNTFLKSRSVEVIDGGRIVFTLSGRKNDHHDESATQLWDPLAQCFANLVSHNIVDEEKVGSYNPPFYAPSLKEIDEEVQREGSFTIEYAEAYEMKIEGGDPGEAAKGIALTIRAIQESMIAHHFGQGIVDCLFQSYTQVLTEKLKKEDIKTVVIFVILRKISN